MVVQPVKVQAKPDTGKTKQAKGQEQGAKQGNKDSDDDDDDNDGDPSRSAGGSAAAIAHAKAPPQTAVEAWGRFVRQMQQNQAKPFAHGRVQPSAKGATATPHVTATTPALPVAASSQAKPPPAGALGREDDRNRRDKEATTAARGGEPVVAQAKGAVVPNPDKVGPMLGRQRSPAAEATRQRVTRRLTHDLSALRPQEALAMLAMVQAQQILAVNLSQAGLQHALRHGFKRTDSFPLSSLGVDLTVLGVRDGEDAISARRWLREALPQEAFGYNYIYRPYQVAAVSSSAKQAPDSAECATAGCYGARLINWGPHLAVCATDVRVGVIDTGYDREHPTFQGNRDRFKHRTFVPAGSAKAPNWHGTGILSLLVGDRHSATPGLIPDAVPFVADAFFADGGGQPVTDTASLVRALEWMSANEVDVVNLSLSGPKDEVLHAKVQMMSAEGTVFVAAAGNEGPGAPPSYPAAYEEVIAVTAVDRNFNFYASANRGYYIDVAAPGVGVWTALPGKRAGAQTGTSFAVPYVTALVAAIYSDADVTRNRGALKTKQTVLSHLETTDLGVQGRDPVYGLGLVKAPASCGQGSRGWGTISVDVNSAQELWPGAVQQVSLHGDK